MTRSPSGADRGADRPLDVAVIGTRGYPSYYGGFETAVRHLAPWLAERGWGVTVYGRPGSTAPADPARDRRVVSRLTRGVESKSLSTLSYGFTAVADAVRRRPDVALVMNVANGFWIPLLRLRGIPVLVNVDGIEWEREKWGRAARAVFRAGAVMTARWGTVLVCDAEEIRRRWNEKWGVDGVFIPYGGSEVGDLPVEPGLTPGGYVLMVARFVPENTVAEFLEAAAVVAQTHDVVVVGSSGYGGELDEAARRLADEHPRVQWLGHLSDDARLFSLWQHAGAYFHGHSVGGTNPALVQAMMCGTPVVARDTVYNREVLADTGTFVEPDPASIAAGLRAVLDDEEAARTMGDAARSRAREHYSWPAICQAYEDELRSLGGRRGRRRSR